MVATKRGVAILGIFVADLAFRANRMPGVGETITGSGFKMGPGGKGSNQAVAAARVGADVTFISRLGKDEFGASALATWQKEGIRARVVETMDEPTGAAFIYVNDRTGDNAIIVFPGAAGAITTADVDAAADAIGNAAVFVTFNPAPAVPVADTVYSLCDYVTPNESEAGLLTGIAVASIDGARRAGDIFLAKGAGAAVITLGKAGALLHSPDVSILIPAFDAGSVVETAGAGDAFNGGFAAAIARGAVPEEAARFASAVAGISVTRAGTAPSMPRLEEVELLLAQQR